MPGYLASFWDPDIDGAAEEATALLRYVSGKERSRLTGDGFFILDLSSAASQGALMPVRDSLGKLTGAAFGTLFEGDPRVAHASRVEMLSGAPSPDYARQFVTRYWGSYVLLLNQRNGFTALTDPLSSLPCFYTRISHLKLVFSNLETCGLPETFRFSVNYSYLASLLVYDKIQTGETGLKEVNELCAGQMLVSDQDEERIETVWNPAKIAAEPMDGSPEILGPELRATVDRAVAACASPYSKTVVNVSGGLDSAIVMGCLLNASDRRHCHGLHHVLDSRDPAELVFAKDLSAHLNCTLKEVRLPPHISLPEADSHPRTVRPFREFAAGNAPERLSAAISEDIGAIFTGQGGDHLFLATDSPLGTADFFLESGFSLRLPSEILSSAKLSGLSVWGVIAAAAATCVKHPPSKMLEAMAGRLSLASQLGVPPLNPHELWPHWSLRPDSLPPAKFQQVSLLPHLVHLRDGMGRFRGRDLIHPLLSQPIIELCLKIPVYKLCVGGVSRGLARRAFSDRLPDSIRRRLTKGHAGMYFSEILETNQKMLVRELLNGELVRCGLLSRVRLQRFLEDGLYRTTPAGNRLVVIYAIEAWLRAWNRR